MRRAIFGYLVAISAASASLALIFVIRDAIFAGTSLAFHPIQLLLQSLFVFLITWPVIAVTAYVPFWLSLGALRILRRNDAWSFLIAGVAVGLVLDPLFAALMNIHGWYTDPPDAVYPTYGQLCLWSAPFVLAAGGIGALAYWKTTVSRTTKF